MIVRHSRIDCDTKVEVIGLASLVFCVMGVKSR
jgi:hypothetical protein